MATEEDLQVDLAKWFNAAVTTEPSVMQECVHICSHYNISGEDLFFKWEAFSFNNTSTTFTAGTSRTIQTLTLDGAKALRVHIAREVAKSNEKQNTARPRGVVPSFAARMRLGGMLNQTSPSPVGTPRNDRIPSSVPAVVKFEGLTPDEGTRRTYRYMFEKISVRSEVLDDRIDEFSELVRQKYDIEELGDATSSTEDIVTVVGRICLDPEADAAASSSKLSATTLVLETSRIGGSGERVPLKFEPDFAIRGLQDASAGKSLFPGEIVALCGRNGGGGWFSVKEVLIIPPPAPSPRMSSRAFSVLIASGPYTPEQTYDFKAFHAVVDEAKLSRPSVLLLLGPFIDASHSLVKSGKLPASPLTTFQQVFLNPIQSLLQQHPDILVLLVPSVRDLLNSHNVFPQGCGERDFGPLPGSVKVLPNPCLFSLNDVRFGVSTVDILYHLKNQQYIQRPQQPLIASNGVVAAASQDAMTNLCRHVLEQRSFYPLFPVPFELSGDVHLDVSHSDYLKLDDPAPDILVLPSILRQFHKSVEGTVMINPSVFGKSRVIAQLNIPTGAGGNTKICDSATVDLKRLS